ncbi:unnamed protein product [Mytilus edulis]|uniref:Tyr recombinase domain-containing protein n=1 Tax=Mytilus edulis TaxID=6550 RepID=A0A8S3R2W1_MYTED|nr:unnamed protein product [Mytilus edulis]
MLSIARNIWLICAEYNIQIKAIHIQGINNRAADILSRWTSLENPYAKLSTALDDNYMLDIEVLDKLFKDTLRICVFLSDNFKNSGSVRNYLSGVKTWAVLLNFDTEEFNSPSLRLTLSGIDKLNANVPNIKLPFEPYHLNCMFEVLDMTSVQDAVMWAVIMTSFYAMLRKSQFANNSRTTFNPKEQLTRGDIQITEEGLIIDIQWSKTSQKHKNIHHIPLKRVEDCVLCPLLAYSRMVTMLPALPGEPAFGLSDSKGKICAFSKSDIDKIVHKLLVRCGMDTSQYSFHSFRRGGATCASAAGCTDSEICTIGNWASSCYKGYIKHSTDKLYYISSNMGLFCKLSN